MYAVRKIILISAVNCIILSLITQLTYQRDPNQEEAKELAAIKQCGTSNDLAHRVEICAKPLLDLIQGTADFWPKNINEVKNLCEQVSNSWTSMNLWNIIYFIWLTFNLIQKFT